MREAFKEVPPNASDLSGARACHSVDSTDHRSCSSRCYPSSGSADIVTAVIASSRLAPVRGRCLIRLLFSWVIVLGLLWTLFIAARVELSGRRDDAPRSDAIVVLGSAQYQGTPSPVFQARLDHALRLYQAGRAPLVVVAGAGLDGDLYTEGTAGADYLRAHGVPKRALLAVGSGDNTHTSLQAVARALNGRKLDSVILVSDRFHMFRSLRIASDLGLSAHGSPTTTSPIDGDPPARLRYTLREVVAYTAYLVAR